MKYEIMCLFRFCSRRIDCNNARRIRGWNSNVHRCLLSFPISHCFLSLSFSFFFTSSHHRYRRSLMI